MRDRHELAFLDLEASAESRKILDIGALREDETVYHGGSVSALSSFLQGVDTLCGHNLCHHDLPLLRENAGVKWTGRVIDTLYLSPLLFPRKPYHALLKDDKLQVEELNNPVNDCRKARDLYQDEVLAFRALPAEVQEIYATLLRDAPEFRDFWREMGWENAAPQLMASGNPTGQAPLYKSGRGDDTQPEDRGEECAFLTRQIHQAWKGLICAHADLEGPIRDHPVELAYALAVIGTGDEASVTPAWVMRNYPYTANLLRLLCAVPCAEGCAYCQCRLDLHRGLQRYFGFREFRTYEGEPLQQKAAEASMAGESLLAIFPTGGGKSITFQLPALLQGETMHGLTVVISPLQSLMKDQVDHLAEAGITGAVTINGLLSPLERAEACEQVLSGRACLLLISPEQLRTRTMERLLQSRTVVRFVIDEAHCFSAWGQDFRVDYLYIGDFIRELQEKRSDPRPIPVSCFTATAKQKVIRDIQDYFWRKLNLRLQVFATKAERKNLQYNVLFRETEQEKYDTIRSLLSERTCPTIIYVSRTRRTRELADRLCSDGFSARPFNGKMTPADKITNQEAFLRNEVRVMVATSAFGMGVDKKDVGLVIHYDISDSLENYVQEAGRAGRDPETQAECYVLFNNNDLDKHFMLLNQTKLSIGEIQQVWRAIKELTRGRAAVSCSPLEIARQAGWESTGSDLETRVKTAVSALENAGYIRRGRNTPQIYASSIQMPSMMEAGNRVQASPLFSEKQRQDATRILKFLISRRSIARAGNDEAESRVDYIADLLGMEKQQVIEIVQLLRQEGILADTRDMSAYILKEDTQNKALLLLQRFLKLESFLLRQVAGETGYLELKKINEAAEQEGFAFSSLRHLRTILNFWAVKGYAQKKENRERGIFQLTWKIDETAMWRKMTQRTELCTFAVEELFRQAGTPLTEEGDLAPVTFSLVGLFQRFQAQPRQLRMAEGDRAEEISLHEMEDALLYLSRIGALKLEGGFLVLYNGMEIHRLEKDNRVRFKQEDYRLLDEFYRQKIQQIHIVGEYANMMVKDPLAALRFVRDYFQMDYRRFIDTYFQGDRAKEINLNITPEKYREIFGNLSDRQEEIIRDVNSRCIVVAAGPGSGKTWVLVRKLASLLLMEDVKHEQLLMLTFTRAAATEFKKRLYALIGNAAHFVEIKTFHSYCFDLLGRVGRLEEAGNAVPAAVRMIEAGEMEPSRIRKSVLVIDEAQDMDAHEYALVRALMAANEGLRVIAVGDDDQNIFGFRGSSSQHMRALMNEPGARMYEMTENYRSLTAIIRLENAWAGTMRERMKQTPLQGIREGAGRVWVIRHPAAPFLQGMARQIQETWKSASAAALTATNEEALQLYTLLRRAGLKAKIVQGMDGFSLENLLEIRVFLNFLDTRLQGNPVISQEGWAQAKTHTEKTCRGSAALEICRNLWRDFEQVTQVKYRSDLLSYIRESREEDLIKADQKTILVSTIHKAKGREFDQVYLALGKVNPQEEEQKRSIYVGLTRAREELYLHYAGKGSFPFPMPDGVEEKEDPWVEPAPAEILLQLGHRDVVLHFFRGRAAQMGTLLSGTPLGREGAYLTAEMNGKRTRVAKLSRACLERISGLERKGYAFAEGHIRYLVAWKAAEDSEECWVILPDLRMIRASKEP